MIAEPAHYTVYRVIPDGDFGAGVPLPEEMFPVESWTSNDIPLITAGSFLVWEPGRGCEVEADNV